MAEEYRVPLHRIAEAAAVGNNVAWNCACERRLPLIGSTMIANDVICNACNRRYHLVPVNGKGSRVAKVEEVPN